MPHRVVKSNGYTFIFKFEGDYPELLHIYARHLKNPEDAIEIFFDGVTTFNVARQRFETYTESEGLYWLGKISQPGLSTS